MDFNKITADNSDSRMESGPEMRAVSLQGAQKGARNPADRGKQNAVLS